MTEDFKNFVKVCGVTTLSDADVAVREGANAIGLIFASSTRQLTLSAGREIANGVEGKIQRVGVFRDNADDEILDALDEVSVDIAQLHGPLSESLCEHFRRRSIKIVKALSIGSEDFGSFDERTVDAVLVDGDRPGSGETYSWAKLGERAFSVPVIVAGGLSPENVALAIFETKASGVDASSGLESGPRHKDAQRISSFVRNARRAFARLGES